MQHFPMRKILSAYCAVYLFNRTANRSRSCGLANSLYSQRKCSLPFPIANSTFSSHPSSHCQYENRAASACVFFIPLPSRLVQTERRFPNPLLQCVNKFALSAATVEVKSALYLYVRLPFHSDLLELRNQTPGEILPQIIPLLFLRKVSQLVSCNSLKEE